MTGQTIGGLFKDQTLGENVLAEMQAAGFATAQISEVDAESTSTSPPRKLNNPTADFFQDHQSSGSDSRNNLAELGMSEQDAHYFEDGVARGGALVTLKADARASDAIAMLRRNGADLGSIGAAAGAQSAVPASSDDDRKADRTLQLKAERLSIDKVRVGSGSVRIRKQVISEQQSSDVPVSHEELVIERHAVTGVGVDGTISADETITIPLSREEVKVGKQTFVTEEVNVGKKAVGGVEHVSDTVRHEELVVDSNTETRQPVR